MGAEADTAALVALLRVGKRPRAVYADRVEEANSPIAVLEAEHGLLAHQLLESASAEIAAWRARGISVLTVLDPEYPSNLRAVHDRPPLVFVAGRLDPCDSRAVAVIGSRRPSAGGVASAGEVAVHLVQSGYTVISGLAAGIDTAAHMAALESGGRTIAVIGSGLDRCYPPANAALQRRIGTECAVVSQFWPEASPSRRSFPERNATMSGLALATVIIEATHTSGARTQARLALGHGRPVLLAASLLEQAWARELAARPGTHVVRSPGEISEIVGRLNSTTLVA